MFQVSLMAARGILPTPPLPRQAFSLTPTTSSVTSRRKRSPSQNPSSHSSASRRRKRGPAAAHAAQNDRDRSPSATPLTQPPRYASSSSSSSSVNLVIGQVKILKRGEKWSAPPKSHDDSRVPPLSTDDPEMLSKEFFAGTTFDESPPPSALPLPSLAWL